MKKVITSIFIIIILSNCICEVFATEDTFRIQLGVKNNSENENFEIYVLLPQEYIEFAIGQSPAWIKDYITYEGADTLKKHDIEGIEVKSIHIQDEEYIEDEVEYVQIKLLPDVNNNYVFDILSNYKQMNMKLRIKSYYKDYIMHIDNFEIKDGICEAEYDYDNDIIKQPDTRKISFSTILLIIILIVVIVVGVISCMKNKE